jgi:hypothetical protein
LPPSVKPSWDDCGVETQAMLLAYSQLRDHEDMELSSSLAKAGVASRF